MANLKEVRIRIASVKSIQQITSAMKMVAASKLRKAQTAIIKLRPYAGKMRDMLQNLSASLENSGSTVFSQVRQEEKILLIVLTSNRGLCGAFNANILKAALNCIQERYSEQYKKGNVSMITIGKKATDYFRKRKFNVTASYDDLLEKMTYEQAAAIAGSIMKDWVNKKYDKVILIYNQFKNAAVQYLQVEDYLPVSPPAATMVPPSKTSSEYIFEPDRETIVGELIPKTLRIQFYKAVLDSLAPEHGARMTAMQLATDNAKELLKQLQLSYNKARQDAITKELLEIVSGAEALSTH